MQACTYYRSQLEWRPYGHLICTPVCLLVGTAFLSGMEGLSQQRLAELMALSHSLYRDHFAKAGLPLKIQELFPLIPAGLFKLEEAAGMVLSQQPQGAAADDLLLTPLYELLLNNSRKERRVIIVTANGHTICFRVEGATLQIFDPLPATLFTLSLTSLKQWLGQFYGSEAALYSAVVITRQSAASCASSFC
jgi:hypothetical protein